MSHLGHLRWVPTLLFVVVAGCASSEDDAASGDEADIIAGGGVTQAQYDREYPWMLSMAVSAPFFEPSGGFDHACGAELIGPDLVLTAGHCVTSSEGEATTMPANSFTFARGTVLQSEMSMEVDGTKTFRAKKVHRHPSYNAATVDFDVALLRLDRPQPGPYAKLADARSPSGSAMRAIGWGDMRRRKSLVTVEPKKPNRLQQTTLTLLDREACRAADDENEVVKISKRMVCASGVGMGDDGKASSICQGDSGGPLLVDTVDGLVVAGVASWIRGCGTDRFPSVFSRIDGELRGWIDRCAEDENACNTP
jgi:trypsin